MESVIKINVGSNKTYIDPFIYGNFIEHQGEDICNGIWTYDPINDPLCKDNPFLIGIRESLIEAVREMKVPIIRAFGGCYSDVYHWKDAIGPRESRKKVKNLQWNRFILNLALRCGGIIENQFGTDEFCHFCETVNAEPYLNVNYSTGTPEEAAQWVEYCNGSTNTEYGGLRTKNGREKPYNVKYWGIANEIWGAQEVGQEKNPKNYAKRYMIFAEAMKAVDSSIKLVVVGRIKSDWNKEVMKHIDSEFIDYLSIHRYTPTAPIQMISPFNRIKSTESRYYSLLTAHNLIEGDINKAWDDIISVYGKKTHVRITFDEWGIWYQMRNVAKTNSNLQDGLCTADILLSFQRMADRCSMANWAQLVNLLGTIRTDNDGISLTGAYYAFKMLSNHSQDYLIKNTSIECHSYNSKKYGNLIKRTNTPLLRCNATIDKDGNNLSVIIINKHISKPQNINLKLENFEPKKKGIKLELNSASPFDYNTEEDRNRITLEEMSLNDVHSTMDVTLSPHSVTILKLIGN
ncbi:MAG: hypothetical protein GY870_06015 [archaeon]|nr:hypothetical protein [archaeon]